jgi:hypothetical protein
VLVTWIGTKLSAFELVHVDVVPAYNPMLAQLLVPNVTKGVRLRIEMLPVTRYRPEVRLNVYRALLVADAEFVTIVFEPSPAGLLIARAW